MHALWYFRERVSKTDTRSYYFSNVLTTFPGLESGGSIAVYAGSESSRMSSKISI